MMVYNRYSRVGFDLLSLRSLLVVLLLVVAAQIERVDGQTDVPNQMYGFGFTQDIAYSPDGTQVAVAHGSLVGLYDVTTRKRVVTFATQTNWVRCIAFSNDGKRILTGSLDGAVKLLDAATGADVRSFAGHTGPVNSVALSTD